MSTAADSLMLITGGSGFLSLHCIAQALPEGYRVRTTVRSEGKKENVIKGLKNAQPPVDISKLEFVVADLLTDEGWEEAARDVSLILHVASPFPAGEPKDENELIRPAVDGTLRVLKAAKAAGTVRRVVVTSSNAAISYGTKYQTGKVFTEVDWSDPDGNGNPMTPYVRSKMLAERTAWDFIEREGDALELAVVNPVWIFGPALLLPNESTTCDLIKQLLTGKLPAVPKISFGVVDVRDVASLHLLAAKKPEAKGQRYLCVAGNAVSLSDTARILRTGLGQKAARTPTRALPDFLVRLMAYVMPQMKSATSELGPEKKYSNQKARSLGWTPRSNEEAIVSCGQALIDAGVCK